MPELSLNEKKQNIARFLQQGQLVEAKRLLEQLKTEAPGDAQVWQYLGLVFAMMKNYQDAISHFNQSLSYNNQDTLTYTYLGQAYIQLHQFDSAIDCLQKGLELNPSSVDCHIAIATVFGTQGLLQNAIQHYEKVIELAPNNANTLGNLAILFERTRQNEKAIICAQKAILIEPSQVSGNLVLARLYRAKGDLDKSENRLQYIIQSYNHPTILANAKIELGHTLDRKKEYRKAYTAFTEGNQAWQQIADQAPFKRNYYFDRIDRYKILYDMPNTIRKDSTPIEEDDINLIFYVGFPRSGTTLMEQILASNENITTTNEEPFIDDLILKLCNITMSTTSPSSLVKPSADQLDSLRKEYFQRVKASTNSAKNNITIIDKFPLNIINVGIINQIFPKSKFIIAYRNPKDVCLSCFMQSFEVNPAMIHLYTLEHAANFYAATMNLWLHYKSVLDINYIEYRYEDLIDDPDTVTKRLVEFIGHEWTKEMSTFYEKASTRQINTPSSSDVTSPIYKRAVNRWKNYSEHIAKIETTLSPFLKAYGYE